MMSVGMEMKEKIKKINWMKELPAVSMQKLSRLDWIISLLILAFCLSLSLRAISS